ncbi:hypothetical protein [Nonomuraea sp. NPDC050691]|uniref:hypothetical protein n=1 Tax=Nonomuraea sp. NPDC050691 TaxID=3155661 RepID=UPI0033E1F24A
MHDLHETGEISLSQRQPCKCQSRHLAEAPRRQEDLSRRSGLYLGDDAAPILFAGSGQRGGQQERTDAAPLLGRVDLEIELGQMIPARPDEQAKER